MSALYKLGLKLGSWKREYGSTAYPFWALTVATNVCLGPLVHVYLLRFYSDLTPIQVVPSSEGSSIMATLSNSIDVFLSRALHYGHWNVIVYVYRTAARGLVMPDPEYHPRSVDTTAAILASLPMLIPQRYYAQVWQEHRWLFFLSVFIWHYGAEYLYPWVSRVLKPSSSETRLRWIYVASRLLSGRMSVVQAIQDHLVYL